MSRFKDFGSGESVNKEPIEFTLYDEKFDCYTAIPGKVLLDFAKGSNTEGSNSDATDAIINFFSKTIRPESYERFTALIEDPERVVEVDTLVSIVEWLVGMYSNRPTQGSEPS